MGVVWWWEDKLNFVLTLVHFSKKIPMNANEGENGLGMDHDEIDIDVDARIFCRFIINGWILF
jgi:hypothetical protein